MGGMERIGARRLALTRPRHQHPGDLRAGLEATVESSEPSPGQPYLQHPRNSMRWRVSPRQVTLHPLLDVLGRFARELTAAAARGY